MATDFSKKSFLIVETLFDMRKTIRGMLQTSLAEDIDEARDGDDALNRMKSRRYDIIICEYNLGDGKNGQQVLEEAKLLNLVNHHTIFVIITTESSIETVIGVIEHVPDDYLAKPFTKDTLQQRLGRLIKKKALMKDIDIAIKRKEFDQAIQLCDAQIEETPPNKLNLMRIKTDIYLDENDFENAEMTAREALAITPELAWAGMAIGKAKFLTGDLVSAREIFTNIITYNRMFMGAYDWLYKIEMANNDEKAAQEILMKAVSVSPNSLIRQRVLGQLALKNNDFDTAQTAFWSAIRQGSHSLFKGTNEYLGFAKSLMERDKQPDALKALERVSRTFSDDPGAKCDASLMKADVYHKMDLPDMRLSSVKEADGYAGETNARDQNRTHIALAKAWLELGEKERGMEIVSSLIKNNHDDDDTISELENIMKENGMGSEVDSVINSVRKKLVDLNNQGVRMVKAGKYDEAIELFIKAVENAPRNKTINLNAAQALIMAMQNGDINNDQLSQANNYLEAVRELDMKDKRLLSLNGQFLELRKEVAPPAESADA
ncbi:MAG: response regulator [Gammaproteobacteria bacterium]|nr:MAG: response regulator [Gammaproteobacteria bacterium]